jgi:hypothetical protein
MPDSTKGFDMRRWILIATVVTTLSVATSAGASAPQHFRFSFPYHFVDDQTCPFPISVDGVFTNDINEFDNPDGTIAGLQLHQSNVATSTGNGVTLTENERTQTFVAFVDGSATQAVHVGTLLHFVGQDGRVALIAGQQVFTVENGFDKTLLKETGLDLDFASDAAFCAAFA